MSELGKIIIKGLEEAIEYMEMTNEPEKLLQLGLENKDLSHYITKLNQATNREWTHNIDQGQLTFDSLGNPMEGIPELGIGVNGREFVVYVEMRNYEQYLYCYSFNDAVDSVTMMMSSALRYNTKVTFKGHISEQ